MRLLGTALYFTFIAMMLLTAHKIIKASVQRERAHTQPFCASINQFGGGITARKGLRNPSTKRFKSANAAFLSR